MKVDISRLGPRGWALMAILSGGVIAVPFMRGSLPALDEPAPTADSAVPTSVMQNAKHPENADRSLPSIDAPNQSTLNDFPEWARKPSPLDALIQGHSNPAIQRASEPARIELRSPTRLEPWTDMPDSRGSATPSSSYSNNSGTPFSDKVNDPNSMSPALARIEWPDKDYQFFPQRNEPKLTELVGVRSEPDKTQADDSVGGSIPLRPNVPTKKPIGAELRSHRIPQNELFILQPGLK